MLQTDSRLVGKGDTFVAVKGATADGARYVPAAIAAGAARVVSEDPPPPDLPAGVAWERVPDSRAAAAALACEDAGHPSRSLDVFAVTGTNGKTTVANLVRRALEGCGRPCGLFSTIEHDPRPLAAAAPVPSHNTTPGPVELQRFFRDALDGGCRAVSVEASSHALDQKRLDGTRLACAVFTNLTQDHLDYHRTMEAYFAAKRRLFFDLAPRAAVVNGDDDAGARLHDALRDVVGPAAPQVLWTYGFTLGCNLRIRNLSLGPAGTAFDLELPGKRPAAAIRTRLLGRHNALNLAAAFGAALSAGLDPAAIAAALCAAPPVRGRLEPVRVAGSPAAFYVDYAHTPDALRNVLETLREFARGRVFAVFGAGGDRDRTKRPLMGETCAKLADECIVTSDNPRSEDPAAIIADILAGMPAAARARAVVEPDRRAALRAAVRLANLPGDIVLVAGKGHEDYQVFADRTVRFDDREELLACGRAP